MHKFKEIVIPVLFHNGSRYSARVEYGMQYLNNNAVPDFKNPDLGPRFCIIGKSVHRFFGASNECVYAFDALSSTTVLAHTYEVATLVPFDQWTQTGLPQRYFNYAIYCFSLCRKWVTLRGSQVSDVESKDYWTRFCKHTLIDESEKALLGIDSTEALTQWLEQRKPYLQAKFHEAMEKCEIEYITPQEILEYHETLNKILKLIEN